MHRHSYLGNMPFRDNTVHLPFASNYKAVIESMCIN